MSIHRKLTFSFVTIAVYAEHSKHSTYLNELKIFSMPHSVKYNRKEARIFLIHLFSVLGFDLTIHDSHIHVSSREGH